MLFAISLCTSVLILMRAMNMSVYSITSMKTAPVFKTNFRRNIFYHEKRLFALCVTFKSKGQHQIAWESFERG